jgi:secretion/DNA translocation related TadE-like protein
VSRRSVRAGSGERGSGTVLVLTFAAVLLLLGCALGVVAAMFHAHRVAESGADLAALAGARALAAGNDPCREAARIAAADGTRVTDCRIDGSAVTVTVLAGGPHWLGQLADLSARARAGPASGSSVPGVISGPALGIPARVALRYPAQLAAVAAVAQ